MSLAPLVIFDCEFTAWTGSWENNWQRPGEHREIIQIAAAIIDPAQDYQVLSELNIYVQPTINPILSTYIMDLTGITQANIDQQGVTFTQAMGDFYNYCAQAKLSAYCYGRDEMAFRECCEINQINFTDYFSHFYDIRTVFQQAGIATEKYQSGSVYKSLDLALDVKQHYASNDVKSMVITLQELHKRNFPLAEYFPRCLLSRDVD